MFIFIAANYSQQFIQKQALRNKEKERERRERFREQITALWEGYEVNTTVRCTFCCCLSLNDLIQRKVRLPITRSDLLTVNTSVKLGKCVAQTFKSL